MEKVPLTRTGLNARHFFRGKRHWGIAAAHALKDGIDDKNEAKKIELKIDEDYHKRNAKALLKDIKKLLKIKKQEEDHITTALTHILYVKFNMIDELEQIYADVKKDPDLSNKHKKRFNEILYEAHEKIINFEVRLSTIEREAITEAIRNFKIPLAYDARSFSAVRDFANNINTVFDEMDEIKSLFQIYKKARRDLQDNLDHRLTKFETELKRMIENFMLVFNIGIYYIYEEEVSEEQDIELMQKLLREGLSQKATQHDIEEMMKLIKDLKSDAYALRALLHKEEDATEKIMH